LLNVKRVAISRVDEEADETYLIASTGLDPEDIILWGADQPRSASDRHPLILQMMETGEPVVLDEITEEQLALLGEQQRANVEAFGIRSLLLVPMYDDGRIVGTMSFDEPGETRHWSRRDVRLAQGLAAQAAVAIRNARLLDEARATREWLEDKVEERTGNLRAAHAEVIANEKLAAVGFMAREVAHGLRNPLNVVSTSLYYLKSRFPHPDEKINRHFDTIARSVEQAANTITQMMNLAGSRQPEMEPTDLNQLAQRTLQDRFTSEEFHWVAQWDPALPPVRADATQLGHAMKALIGYAAASGRLVHIYTCRDDGYALFALGDDRPPLTEEERRELFLPFFASATEWTGLGLSVARQIAAKHNGDLTLEDADGRTWVRLRLPFWRAADERPGPAQA
jgi:signal transduction histidine kinase